MEIIFCLKKQNDPLFLDLIFAFFFVHLSDLKSYGALNQTLQYLFQL
jgi:hypothetical protein